MIDELYLYIGEDKFAVILDYDSGIVDDILKSIPFEGISITIKGEIYFLIEKNVSFNGKEKEVFSKGDVVYWKSQKAKKYAIAIFWGNTKFGENKIPKASSPCIKFAHIKGDYEKLSKTKPGTKIVLSTSKPNPLFLM